MQAPARHVATQKAPPGESEGLHYADRAIYHIS
jgi:hypothetical protein